MLHNQLLYTFSTVFHFQSVVVGTVDLHQTIAILYALMLVITVHHVTYPVCVLVIVGGKEMTVVQISMNVILIKEDVNISVIIILVAIHVPVPLDLHHIHTLDAKILMNAAQTMENVNRIVTTHLVADSVLVILDTH